MFQSYASLGNSVTAGYQSGGINDSTQKMPYARRSRRRRTRASRCRICAMPGCAPPVDTFPSHRVTPIGYPVSTATSCYLRTTGSVTPVVNNEAVPGAASVDPVSATTLNSNALTTFILGGATQVQRATQLNPTFVSMWIGNNDVLAAALSGVLVPVPTISPGVTPQATFVANYKNDINGLRSIASLKGGVVFGVVDVTYAPLLFHSNLLFVPAIKGAFNAAAGTVTAVDASCNDPVRADQFPDRRRDQGRDAPAKRDLRADADRPRLPARWIVRPDLRARCGGGAGRCKRTLRATIRTSRRRPTRSAGRMWMSNPALQALKTANLIPPFPNLLSPTQTFGTYFTLDGVHPSGLAHQLIANLMVDSVNAHVRHERTRDPLTDEVME